MERFGQALAQAGLGDRYEAAHARLAIECAAAARRRQDMLSEGKLARLPEGSQEAADASYIQTTQRLLEGIESVLNGYPGSDDPQERKISGIWASVQQNRAATAE
jgi:hypothetical protein